MPFIGNKPASVPLTSADITDGIIVNADINASAAIAKTKLNLAGTIGISDLSATGTASSSTFLRGDNTWGSAGATAGQVIQVVSATDSSTRSTTSTSFVTASNTLSVSITPSSTANKIFVIVNHYMYGSGNNAQYTIYRSSTNLGGVEGIAWTNNAGSTETTVCYTIYDSPSTTSATTYQVYMKVSTGTGYCGLSGFKSTITAFEIKG